MILRSPKVLYNSSRVERRWWGASYIIVVRVSVTRESIEGYVKVVSLYGERKYYVSVTDGKRGIKEIDADQLKVSSASNFKKLDETYINSKKCELE